MGRYAKLTPIISVHVWDANTKRLAKLIKAISEYIDESTLVNQKFSMDLDLGIKQNKKKDCDK